MEAEKLNLNYMAVAGMAKLFEEQTQISQVFNMQVLVEQLGGVMEYKNLEDEAFCFVDIKERNKFNVNLPQNLDNEFKRFLMMQVLGHYVLHSQSGEVPCKVKSIANPDTSKEAIWFALNILINDELMEKNNKMSNEELARLFRVPAFAISMKKNILNQIKGVEQ